MSTRQRIAIFSILAVLALTVVGSVSAQNNSTEQQSSQAGSNGTTTGGNITSSTAA